MNTENTSDNTVPDSLTPEEREKRGVDLITGMLEDYNHSPSMEGHETEDFAVMKDLGWVPSDLPDKADQEAYAAFLKNNS